MAVSMTAHRFPTHLKLLKYEIEGHARSYGLDFFDTIFEVLDYDERREFLGPRLDPLREALARRRLRLVVRAAHGQSWGFLEELGAEIKFPRV